MIISYLQKLTFLIFLLLSILMQVGRLERRVIEVLEAGLMEAAERSIEPCRFPGSIPKEMLREGAVERPWRDARVAPAGLRAPGKSEHRITEQVVVSVVAPVRIDETPCTVFLARLRVARDVS